ARQRTAREVRKEHQVSQGAPPAPSGAAAHPACSKAARRAAAVSHRRTSMEKRVVFRHKTLPYLLLAPQIAVTLVFFFWPAGQAMWQSMQLQDAFGLS